MKIKFFYITDDGYEWLRDSVFIHNPTMERIKDVYLAYIHINQDKADSLTNGWRLNGEESCDLTPCCECDDKDIENYLNNLEVY